LGASYICESIGGAIVFLFVYEEVTNPREFNDVEGLAMLSANIRTMINLNKEI
jgi:hypothetical protein